MPVQSIKGLFKSEHAIAALYVALLGGALANIIPDPTDALGFYLDRKYRIELEEGKITPSQYWERKLGIFYLLDSLWWLIILAVAILVKGDIKKKATVVGALIGGGLVIGIIFSNIKKDQEFFDKYEFVKKQ